MEFVDLNRNFVRVENDKTTDSTSINLFESDLFGSLYWSDLLKRHRVVVLAEADSGKTEEFINCKERLSNQGKFSFFSRIEELADNGFSASLDHSDGREFSRWAASTEDGYFFLDSLDEARLNRKSFDAALRRFSSAIDGRLEHCHVYISCRISDWRGNQDKATIERILPHEALEVASQEGEDDADLLDPIFAERVREPRTTGNDDSAASDLCIVRLAALTSDRQQQLAQAAGVTNPDAFKEALWLSGLDALSDRPGDLLVLARYWQEHQKFGRLQVMMDESVSRKLSESDPHRSDNIHLTADDEEFGAERVAAAMTLGQTFTIRIPGDDYDADMMTGALDSRSLFPEWSDAKRTTLLRRGVFAPATYGRVRFHHRATQEFLTAKWLNRLISSGCPRENVFNLVFTKTYGVKTVIPSLRPVAAWLALDNQDIRKALVDRAPLALIQCGDPASLDLETRKEMLRTFVAKHSRGEISNDQMEYRSLWMFTHQDLAETIREVWKKSGDFYVRAALMRLVGAGKLQVCLAILREVALDAAEDEYLRIVAVQALAKCGDRQSLQSFAGHLAELGENASIRLAAHTAEELFPDILSVDQLFFLIESTGPPPPGSTEGFGYRLRELWKKCPINRRKDFIGRLADLVLSEPFKSRHERISSKYRFLAKHLCPIVLDCLNCFCLEDPDDELVQLTMALERTEDLYLGRDCRVDICKTVRATPSFQRRLFWADVEEARENREENGSPVFHWQIFFHSPPLWRFSKADFEWLLEDLGQKESVDDRRIALSALISILQESGELDQYVEGFREIVSQFPILCSDLERHLKPRQEEPWEKEQHKRKRERDKRRERDKQSWRDFKKALVEDPERLLRPSTQLDTIHILTRWLRRRAEADASKSARQWKLMIKPFGQDVAYAYKKAMLQLWRATRPARPIRKPGSVISVKWTTIFSFAGIGIEADEDPEWAEKLSDFEVRRAAAHGCQSEQGYPDWMDSLLDARSSIVLPYVKRALRTAWTSGQQGKSDFLYHYRRPEANVHPEISDYLLHLILKVEAPSEKEDVGLDLLERLHFSTSQRARVRRFALDSFAKCQKNSEDAVSRKFLALLFLVDPDEGTRTLLRWIRNTNPAKREALVLDLFGSLFSREYRRSYDHTLLRVSSRILRTLAAIGYRHIRPIDDVVHHGPYSRGPRDRAETGRSAVLSALVEKRELAAYQSLTALASRNSFKHTRKRFMELAQRMAERDSEKIPWREQEVADFEFGYTLPAKSGGDLLSIVLGVMKDIRHQFLSGDASSKPLLAALSKIGRDDEDSVQSWLAEQLDLRSLGRYHVHRETEIANKDKPDIVVSATSAKFEVAIEVKQADSWSPNELQTAVNSQLAERYLQVDTRRHGVLFITDHGRRRWKHPSTKRSISFDELVNLLAGVAASKTTNSSGSIRIDIFGLDCTISD